MMMDPQIKTEWMQVLRSGKYKQGRARLRAIYPDRPDELCCLGVLCEMAVEKGVIATPRIEEVADYDHMGGRSTVMVAAYESDETTVLPQAVAEWAGLMDSYDMPLATGGYNVEPDAAGALYAKNALAADNDEGKTFSQIADIIEREF